MRVRVQCIHQVGEASVKKDGFQVGEEKANVARGLVFWVTGGEYFDFAREVYCFTLM